MRPPRAVIAQTGHSGSGYMAEVLRQSGVKAGHEGYFNPLNRYIEGLDVDVAWPATCALEKFDGIVWHQVRDPMKTITSLAFTAGWHNKYMPLREQVMREVTGDRILDSIIAYVDFNLKAEAYASRRWRVEDIDAKLVKSLVRELGYKPDGLAIRRALKSTSSTTNSHYKAPPLQWYQLPNHPILDEFQDMAYRYGYEIA